MTLRSLPCIICGKKALYYVGCHGLYCTEHRTEALAAQRKDAVARRRQLDASFYNSAPIPNVRTFHTPADHVRAKGKKQGISNGGRILPHVPILAESVKLTRKPVPRKVQGLSSKYLEPAVRSKCLKGSHYECISSSCTCKCHSQWRSAL